MLGLKLPTDPRWVNIAEMNIDEILTDHAFCEQKAASTAISLIVGFPEYTALVQEMTALVEEEISHFKMVHDLIIARGKTLGRDRKDAYVVALLKFFPKGGSRTTQLVHRLTGRIDGIPLIPIFINCAAPPQPTFRRTRELGAAVGRFANSLGKRVLIMASGGLSHDPPIAALKGAPPEVAEFLIAGRNPTPDARAARQERVRGAGKVFAAGSPDFVPLDEEWDRIFLDRIVRQDLDSMDEYDDQDVTTIGGRGGHEIRAWVAAAAALAAAGPYQSRVDFYRAIPEWIAGFGMLRGVSDGGSAPPLD